MIRPMIVLDVYKRLQVEMGDLGWWPAETGDEIIIGTILTQNTSWNNVEKSLESLRKNDLISLRGLCNTDPEQLSEIIRSSGFHNQKARRLIGLSRRIVDTYGDLSRMSQDSTDSLREFLSAAKGVGRETMDSILLYALSKPVFVVDKYTERIFSRTGVISDYRDLLDLQTRIPDILENDVEKLKNFHGMIVQLAKDHCRKKPACESCPLSVGCRHYSEAILP